MSDRHDDRNCDCPATTLGGTIPGACICKPKQPMTQTARSFEDIYTIQTARIEELEAENATLRADVAELEAQVAHGQTCWEGLCDDHRQAEQRAEAAESERDQLRAQLEAGHKTECVAFFRWWWLQAFPTTTDQGYDQWVSEGKPGLPG